MPFALAEISERFYPDLTQRLSDEILSGHVRSDIITLSPLNTDGRGTSRTEQP
jgi:hypothetical protein